MPEFYHEPDKYWDADLEQRTGQNKEQRKAELDKVCNRHATEINLAKRHNGNGKH